MCIIHAEFVEILIKFDCRNQKLVIYIMLLLFYLDLWYYFKNIIKTVTTH